MLSQEMPQLMQIVDISIPELELIRNAHLATFGGESCNALKHLLAKSRRKLSLETRATLRASEAFTAAEYVQAQQVRWGQWRAAVLGCLDRCVTACELATSSLSGSPASRICTGSAAGPGCWAWQWEPEGSKPVPDCALQEASGGTPAS